jgi:hypothetical protein
MRKFVLQIEFENNICFTYIQGVIETDIVHIFNTRNYWLHVELGKNI